MKIDLKPLRELVEKGLLSCRKHPTAPLLIWNYTHKCVWDKAWDENTRMCRGLITDEEGNVRARPFKKFFNFGEHQEALPDGPFRVFEKMDGYLGILYWIDDKPFISTRGSFTSEFAEEANKILYENYQSRFSQFDKSKTYLFEIIYPSGRIVVDYGEIKDLILLAIIDIETGKEEPPVLEGFLSAPVYDFKSVEEMRSAPQKGNAEGYVISWENGLRLKVKFDEYVRLHRLLTETRPIHVWEMMLKKTNMEKTLGHTPRDFYAWVRKTASGIMFEWHRVYEMCIASYNGIAIRNKPKTRKDWAKRIQHTTYPSILFNMLDGKDLWEPIMKVVKPKSEKPFKQDIDS